MYCRYSTATKLLFFQGDPREGGHVRGQVLRQHPDAPVPGQRQDGHRHRPGPAPQADLRAHVAHPEYQFERRFLCVVMDHFWILFVSTRKRKDVFAQEMQDFFIVNIFQARARARLGPITTSYGTYSTPGQFNTGWRRYCCCRRRRRRRRRRSSPCSRSPRPRTASSSLSTSVVCKTRTIRRRGRRKHYKSVPVSEPALPLRVAEVLPADLDGCARHEQVPPLPLLVLLVGAPAQLEQQARQDERPGEDRDAVAQGHHSPEITSTCHASHRVTEFLCGSHASAMYSVCTVLDTWAWAWEVHPRGEDWASKKSFFFLAFNFRTGEN